MIKTQRKQLMCHLVSMALVDIRQMLWRDRNNVGQAADLADIFHNVLNEINGQGLWDASTFRNELLGHQNRYGGRNYVVYFDKIFPCQLSGTGKSSGSTC